MKAFVTGGSGFVGSYLIPKLVERGYEVFALARSGGSADRVRELGATPVEGDILDPDSMRGGMAGSDVVFHVAGWYKTGASDWMNAEPINVNGTRNVLGLAHELGVPKIVYTSTVAIFGDTHGKILDENASTANGPFITEYDRTKWMAHHLVAKPLIDEGAPIVIVMPGGIYGPGDHSLLMQQMRQFYRGEMLFMLSPAMTITWAYVEDVAEGHILAAEKGKVGESYILTGPAIPMGEMVDFWAYITGRPAPLLKVPPRFLKPFAPLVGALEESLPLPELVSEEAMNMLDVSYAARADKARNELGWQPRSPQAGMLETFNWIAEQEGPVPVPSQEEQVAKLALIAAAILLIFWLLGRRPRRKDGD